jgi:hypothetical protein
MNKIRLLVLVAGLTLIIIGLYRIVMATLQNQEAPFYSPAVLILIGGMLIIAVRKK